MIPYRLAARTFFALATLLSFCATSSYASSKRTFQNDQQETQNPDSEAAWNKIFTELTTFTPDMAYEFFIIQSALGGTDPFNTFYLLNVLASKPKSLIELENKYGAPDNKQVLLFYSEDKKKDITPYFVWNWGPTYVKAEKAEVAAESCGFEVRYINEHFHGPVSDQPEPYATMDEALQFTEEIGSGSNTLTVTNKNKKGKARVVLRSRAKGKVLDILPKKQQTVSIPDGHYIIYYEFSDLPGLLLSSQSFGLKGYGITISLEASLKKNR